MLSASFLLTVLVTSFLTANAAPLHISSVAARAANDNNADFQAACDAGGVAGSLVGNAITLIDAIQTNDPNVASQIAAVKGVLEATGNVGAEVAAACQNAGLAGNNNANNNAQNNNSNANQNQNQNSNNADSTSAANQASATQANNNNGKNAAANAQAQAQAQAQTQAQAKASKATSTSSSVAAQKTVILG
ncbi:hypothetical protein B0H19DRAFT_309291 [Mycena capillaripes]|nr:hypothetical protein B0H19DRAFT_309291 [Mycena capillaripes]